jgi:transcriptional regulator with PAS, ATPase and Fis domain
VGWSEDEIAHASESFDALADLVAEDGAQIVGELGDEARPSLEAFVASGVSSLMILPLPGEERGLLVLDTRSAPFFFDLSDLRLAESLAARAGELFETSGDPREASPRIASPRRELAGMVSRSSLMHEVFALLERAASSSVPVLILGESGTGKELAARALHQLSPRADQAFMSENCVAIPGGLLESALFGHKRGAFTGADADKPGLFELADRGTLLLDEIGELPPELQAKLLRVLQEGEFRRLGESAVRRVDVRVVAATHRDPAERIASGALREDLYYRLAAITVRMPALRERPEDVGLLAEHFLRRGAKAMGRDAPSLSSGALHLLCSYGWPGNVRELENLMQRLLILEPGASITRATIERIPELLPGATPRPSGSEGKELEKLRILDALVQSGGHRGRAAAALGISRATLFRRLKEHGLTG